MTPGARVQAAIEVLDLVIQAARNNGPPADRILAEWFRTRRYAGSGDRRAVRELVYAAIRACGKVPASGRAAMLALAAKDPALAALFDGQGHAPAPIEVDEPKAKLGVAQGWVSRMLAASDIEGSEAAALLDRAPLDVRINTLKGSEPDLLLAAERTSAPDALRFPAGTPVEQWPAYDAGAIEVQDSGSQIACLAVAAQPSETLIDLCAGAGGKTLALAAAMDDRGVLIAADTDRGRLSRLPPRAVRAGATIIQTLLLNPAREAEALAPWCDRADAVLVDAPCSGTGTWRRNPEGRWRITEREIIKLTALQARLLDLAATLVRPGGRLVHVVCSLLDAEGPDQVAAFLTRHPQWRADAPSLPAGTPRGAGVRLTPHADGTDGFFIARLIRL